MKKMYDNVINKLKFRLNQDKSIDKESKLKTIKIFSKKTQPDL